MPDALACVFFFLPVRLALAHAHSPIYMWTKLARSPFYVDLHFAGSIVIQVTLTSTVYNIVFPTL